MDEEFDEEVEQKLYQYDIQIIEDEDEIKNLSENINQLKLETNALKLKNLQLSKRVEEMNVLLREKNDAAGDEGQLHEKNLKLEQEIERKNEEIESLKNSSIVGKADFLSQREDHSSREAEQDRDASYKEFDARDYEANELSQPRSGERERFAKERGYGYVEFNFQGEIACAATGAGLAMTSMDLINDIAPQALAFFLDVGGRFVGSTGDVLELADMFPNLKAILVNRYGGFGRGEIIAESIVKGLLEIRPKVPVMVHLSGSGEKGAIEYFRTWEPKIREAGVVFEWTSQTVTGKESENATKGGIDIIETPVRKVMEWAGYEFKRNPPEWFPQRTDWEGKTRHLIKEALSKRPEEEYRKLAEVE